MLAKVYEVGLERPIPSLHLVEQDRNWNSLKTKKNISVNNILHSFHIHYRRNLGIIWRQIGARILPKVMFY